MRTTTRFLIARDARERTLTITITGCTGRQPRTTAKTVWYDGQHAIRTAEGKAENRIAKGDYRIVATGEERWSDDPTAPCFGSMASKSKQGNSEQVMNLSILRRPGGSIPKARGESDKAVRPHHLRMQVYQDFEERGTPIPEKWDGKKREEELTTRLKQIKAILEAAEKNEKEQKKHRPHFQSPFRRTPVAASSRDIPVE